MFFCPRACVEAILSLCLSPTAPPTINCKIHNTRVIVGITTILVLFWLYSSIITDVARAITITNPIVHRYSDSELIFSIDFVSFGVYLRRSSDRINGTIIKRVIW